jgi:hypothetical protein
MLHLFVAIGLVYCLCDLVAVCLQMVVMRQEVALPQLLVLLGLEINTSGPQVLQLAGKWGMSSLVSWAAHPSMS